MIGKTSVLVLVAGLVLATSAFGAPEAETGVAAPSLTATPQSAQDVCSPGLSPEDTVVNAATAFCRADCEDGSSVSVSCSGTCRAVDQNCPNTRGHVECNGVVTARCPICDPGCTVSRFCPDGTFISCTSSSGDCIGGGDACFVRCDGQFTFCPGQEPFIIC